MKKTLIVIAAIALMSFTTQEDKKVTLTLTVEEVNLIYTGLGELPAKISEPLRYKIVQEAQKQLNKTDVKK